MGYWNNNNMRNPDLPWWAYDNQDEDVDVLSASAFGAFVGAMVVGFAVFVLFMSTGTGDDAHWEPSFSAWFIALGALAGAVAAQPFVQIRFVIGPKLYPPLKFKSSDQMQAYVDYQALSDSETDDARLAYNAFIELPPTHPQWYDVKSVWNNTLSLVKEKRDLLLTEAGVAGFLDAKDKLEALRREVNDRKRGHVGEERTA